MYRYAMQCIGVCLAARWFILNCKMTKVDRSLIELAYNAVAKKQLPVAVVVLYASDGAHRIRLNY